MAEEPDIVHPSLQSISQYDSESEQQQEGEDKNKTEEVLAPSPEDPGEEEEDVEDGEDVEEEVEKEKVPQPELPSRRERARRRNAPHSFNLSEFEYNNSAQMPSPPTEVSSSESDDDYRPNQVVKTKAAPYKRPKQDDEMKAETEAAHGGKPVGDPRPKCTVCGNSYSSQYNLTRHIRNNPSCSRQKARPKPQNVKKEEEATNTNPTPIECHLCGQKFTKIQYLKRHQQAKHSSSEKLLMCCDECKQGFSRREELKKHIELEHSDENVEELMERSTGRSAPAALSPPRKKLRSSRNNAKKYVDSSSSPSEDSRSPLPADDMEDEVELPTSGKVNLPASPDIVDLQQGLAAAAGGKRTLPPEAGIEESPSFIVKEKEEADMTRSRSSSNDSTKRMKVLGSNGNGRGSGKMTCGICGHLSSDNHKFKRHMLVHSGNRPFKCHFCKASYIQKNNLMRHIRLIHESEKVKQLPVDKRFKCVECSSRFTMACNLTRHMKSHHPSWNGWQTPAGLDMFRNKDGSASGRNLEKAPSAVLSHEEYVDIMDYFEDEAESDTDTNPEAAKARYYESLKNGYDDDVMPLIFPYLRKLQREKYQLLHNNTMQVNGSGDGNRKVMVEINNDLLSHFINPADIPSGNSSPVVKIENREDGAHTLPKTALRTNIGRPKYFECSYCKKRFAGNSHLIRHIRVHTGEKPFECSVCSWRFAVRNNLTAHMLTHNNDKKSDQPRQPEINRAHTLQMTAVQTDIGQSKFHECPYCKKRFSANWLLIRHVRVHTGEKPFECSLCSKRFSMRGNLTAHMLVHTGEKSRPVNVKSRQAEMNREKCYKCVECKVSFYSRSTLWAHKRNHSKTLQPPETSSTISAIVCADPDPVSSSTDATSQGILSHVDDNLS